MKAPKRQATKRKAKAMPRPKAAKRAPSLRKRKRSATRAPAAPAPITPAPAPCTSRTPRPQHVQGSAIAIWNRLAPIMEDAGRLDENTVDAFVYLCWQIADYEDMRLRVAALDDIVLWNTNGTRSIHPYEKIRQSRARELAAALKEWGLTPASLGRLGVTNLPLREQDEHTAFEEL